MAASPADWKAWKKRRTVAVEHSRCCAIRGAAQPASDSSSISTRSRSAGRSLGSRRSAWTASRCSALRTIRIMPQVYTNHGGPLSNLVVSLPTGAGKTLVAEFAVLTALQRQQPSWVAYVAPSRALVNQASRDLRRRLADSKIEVRT